MRRKINFGHCIGCDRAVPPPYLSFKVMQWIDDGNSASEWDEVDVCDACAGELTAQQLYALVSEEEEEQAE